MQRSLVALAATVKTQLNSAPATKVLALSDQLLGAIALYRRLLRVHRKVLPIEMRLMGDDYVKVRPPLVSMSERELIPIAANRPSSAEQSRPTTRSISSAS